MRLRKLPFDTTAVRTRSRAASRPWLCTALAEAEESTFSVTRAPTFGTRDSCASASSTDSPRTSAATRLSFLGLMRTPGEGGGESSQKRRAGLGEQKGALKRLQPGHAPLSTAVAVRAGAGRACAVASGCAAPGGGGACCSGEGDNTSSTELEDCAGVRSAHTRTSDKMRTQRGRNGAQTQRVHASAGG